MSAYRYIENGYIDCMEECWHCGREISHWIAGRTGGLCDGCEYMSKADAARRLHVHPNTIVRMLEGGSLKGYKPSPMRLLLRRAEIEALLREER